MSISIASHYTQIYYDWPEWANVHTKKKFIYQHFFKDNLYTIWGYDGPEIYVCTLLSGTLPDSIVESGVSQENNDSHVYEWETYYKQNSNKILEPKTLDGKLRATLEKPDGSRMNVYTHDWADKTTWYTDSIRVTTESVQNNNNVYQLSHSYVIDSYHGKLTSEDFLKDSCNRSYRVLVYSSGTLLTEQNPHYGYGGDYVVNYKSGSITAINTSSFIDPIQVSYHYATTSNFYLKPLPGKLITINQAEIQFSEDVEIKDTIVFQPYGKVEYFAPQYLGIYPAGTPIPLGNPIKYKTVMDYLNESMRSYAQYPAFGGDSWRGVNKKSLVLDWDYVSAQSLYSSEGMYIKISLEHHEPFSGSFATATFYCVSENE
jgi:hypothetical protein